MVKVNAEALKEYLDRQGRGAISALAVESGISVHTLMRLAGGYYAAKPSRRLINALLGATGIPEDRLLIREERAS